MRTCARLSGQEMQHPKWSHSAVKMMKYAVEQNLLNKLGNAWTLACHGNRLTLTMQDLRLAKEIMDQKIDQRASGGFDA